MAFPVKAAQISASAFRISRVPPLLRRLPVDADEHAAAPPVLLTGYDEWQRRFGGDTRIVNHTFARRLLGGGNAVGQRARERQDSNGPKPWLGDCRRHQRLPGTSDPGNGRRNDVLPSRTR